MPNRDLKDSNRRSASLQILSDAAERLWYRLITAVDDFGRMEAHPEVVFSTCFQRPPKGWSAQKVASCLKELGSLAPPGDHPLIQLYQHGRKEYLQILSSPVHIYRRAKLSKWPAPDVVQPADALTRIPPPTPPSNGEQMPTSVAAPPDNALAPFATFWAAYPRKDGRADAQAAWAKLKPSMELVAVMLPAIETAKKSEQWTRDNGQFIPMPATYLRKRRWEDEGIVKRALSTPRLPEKPIVRPPGEAPSPEAKAALSRILPGFMADQEASSDVPRLPN